MNSFLETERLILKPIALADLDNIFALRSDPEVMKYVGDGSIWSKEKVREFIECGMQYYAEYGLDFFSVFEKETGTFVGQAGLFHVGFDVTSEDIEVAYRLHKKFWGHGYATELARALIHWGFENLFIKKIVAFTHLENMSSRRVLEKVDMQYCGKKQFKDQEMHYYEIYKNDAIELVQYSNQWPALATAEIKNLYDILPSKYIIDIQHVGSTAIPGMLAKPIIDIQIATTSLETIKPIAIEALKKLEYVFWYENPDSERMFFAKGMPPFGEKRTHHVHIVEPASKHWQGKIVFRDYLIAHPEVARDYAELKIKLGKQYKYDREKYTDAKTKFIYDIIKRCSCRFRN